MIRFFVRHPVATWMIFTAAIVCGVYALPKLDYEAMPETMLPSLTIYTNWNGASPSAIQQAITVPIEAAARKCYGQEKVVSRSQPGRSSVTVEFRREANMDFARLELSEQLGAVRRDLPATASPPVIVPYIPSEFGDEDFFTVSLISPLSTNELRERAEDWIQPRLQAVDGVAEVEIQGGALPLIKILLDLQRMENYDLTADVIQNRLAELDDIIPAGAIRRSGRELIVSVSDSVAVSTLENAILRTSGGQPITLGHVATVDKSYDDPLQFVRINGRNVVRASVGKRSGENAVACSRRLRAALPEIQEAVPFEFEYEIDEDAGEELEEKLQDLGKRSGIILGLLFVLLAIALRRFWLTAIVVFSILLAIVICLSLFYFFDISVNFITIAGLTVCFGMLLDNSILVLDAIHRRLGLSRKSVEAAGEALVSGAKEVLFPILATTFTTVVAFLSFIFMSSERLTLFYGPLAISIAFAMVASIFVAFCWLPVALRGPAFREMKDEPEPEASADGGWRMLVGWILGVVALGILGGIGWLVWHGADGFRDIKDNWIWIVVIFDLLLVVGAFAAFVGRITENNVRHWWVPALVMAVMFGGGWWVFENEVHQGGMWGQGQRENIICYVERPTGTDVKLSSETMKLFEAEILPLPEGITARSWSWENRAYMRIEFEEEMLRSAYPEAIRNQLILLAEELGGMFIWINGFGDPYLKGGRGGGMSNSLIKISGYNSKVLDEICAGVIDRLGRNRRVRNVRLASGVQFEREGADETVVVIHRDKLAEYQLSVAEATGHLRRLLGVETPWYMIVEGESQRLEMSFADSENIQYDQIMGKTLYTGTGQQVRLSDLIHLEKRQVLPSINREDQRYTMQVNWEYIGTDRMRQKFIDDIVAGIELPYGYKAEDVSGQRMTREEEDDLTLVLWLALGFIFMALAAMFESFSLPLLVLLAIPMALSGVVGIFWAADESFDSSAKIGLVLLFGIVVNNAILLINRFRLQIREIIERERYPDYLVPRKRRLGSMDLWRLQPLVRRALLLEAITTGTRIQMRSILLTSGTTIAGLVPLLFKSGEQGEGNEIWNNLALASVGGLASSTVLILSAIPAMYWIMTRYGWSLLRLPHRTLAWTLVAIGSAASLETLLAMLGLPDDLTTRDLLLRGGAAAMMFVGAGLLFAKRALGLVAATIATLSQILWYSTGTVTIKCYGWLAVLGADVDLAGIFGIVCPGIRLHVLALFMLVALITAMLRWRWVRRPVPALVQQGDETSAPA